MNKKSIIMMGAAAGFAASIALNPLALAGNRILPAAQAKSPLNQTLTAYNGAGCNANCSANCCAACTGCCAGGCCAACSGCSGCSGNCSGSY